MRLPVLTYHAVFPLAPGASARGTVSLRDFEQQLAWLSGRGYEALSLDRAAELIAEGGPARRKIALTFDDGYACVFDHALPALERAGFTATLFIPTGFVGGKSDWYAPKGGAPLEHAGWDRIETAARAGFEIGAHGVQHERLGQLEPGRVAEEVGESKREIEQRIGRCRHFAYPYGDAPDAAVRAARDAGYATASTTQRGFNRRGQPPLALRRQSISRTTDLGRFRRRAGAWL
jgi:peptidoglycan/xylan/chitin deacetylase (PgdA/CDA1 family)